MKPNIAKFGIIFIFVAFVYAYRRMPRFGDNLRNIRERQGLTQEDLARRLGYARPATISILESRDQIPTPKTIVKLATGLVCPPSELLLGVVTPYDALRGSIEPTGPAAAGVMTLRDDYEKRLLRTYRTFSPERKAEVLEYVLFVARLVRRHPAPHMPAHEPSEPERSSGAPTDRGAPGESTGGPAGNVAAATAKPRTRRRRSGDHR